MADTRIDIPAPQAPGSAHSIHTWTRQVYIVTGSPLITQMNVSNFSNNLPTVIVESVGNMEDIFENLTDVFVNSTNLLVNVTAESAERVPVTSKMILIILYTLTTLAALLGNSLAIIVFAKGKRSNTDLRPFLINLAVADLIMAIFCIPFTFAYQITDNWVFSDFMCPVVQGCQVVSVTASVSTNTAIGIDRLIAVKFPLRRRVTDSKSKVFILGIWIFALSLGVIPFVICRTFRRPDATIACEEVFLDEDGRVVYGFAITIVTYFLPVTVLSVTYSMIGRLLWRHKVPGNADGNRDAAQLKAKRKVVKMLATIVLLFGLCWLPLHLFITITTTFKHNIFGDLAYDIYFGVHWLSMANSFVNPVVYGFMNENFRADLRCLAESYICCFCGHRRLRYRPAAVRWRLGDSNVHDTSQSSTHTYISKTFTQREMELESLTPTQKRLYRKDKSTTAPVFNVSKKYSSHIRSSNGGSSGQERHIGYRNQRNILATGQRRHYDLCQSGNTSMEENGVLLMKNTHNNPNEAVQGNQRFELHPVVLLDKSDVMVFNDHYKNSHN